MRNDFSRFVVFDEKQRCRPVAAAARDAVTVAP